LVQRKSLEKAVYNAASRWLWRALGKCSIFGGRSYQLQVQSKNEQMTSGISRAEKGPARDTLGQS
jgi:hypothetical protein